MYNQLTEFEWDDHKAEANLIKHGISFERAKQVFDDVRALPFADLKHSESEERFKMIGLSSAGLLFVSFTYRNQRVRIISARRSDKRMQRMYESDDYD